MSPATQPTEVLEAVRTALDTNCVFWSRSCEDAPTSVPVLVSWQPFIMGPGQTYGRPVGARRYAIVRIGRVGHISHGLVKGCLQAQHGWRGPITCMVIEDGDIDAAKCL